MTKRNIIRSIADELGLILIGFAANVVSLMPQPRYDIVLIAGIIGLVAFYSVICFVFAKITQQEFSRMEPHTPEADGPG